MLEAGKYDEIGPLYEKIWRFLLTLKASLGLSDEQLIKMRSTLSRESLLNISRNISAFTGEIASYTYWQRLVVAQAFLDAINAINDNRELSLYYMAELNPDLTPIQQEDKSIIAGIAVFREGRPFPWFAKTSPEGLQILFPHQLLGSSMERFVIADTDRIVSPFFQLDTGKKLSFYEDGWQPREN